MKTDKVLSAIENSIIRVSGDIRKKKGAVGCDKLNSLAKLTNSYNRLLERSKAMNEDPAENYYDSLERGCDSKK